MGGIDGGSMEKGMGGEWGWGEGNDSRTTSHYYNLVVLIIFLCRTFDKILKVIFLVSHWIGHN